MDKNEVKTESTELITMDSVKALPTLIPNMDKRELFNTIQDTLPIDEIVGKEFSIRGIFPEIRLVPRDSQSLPDGFVPVDEEMVERLCVIFMTDVGVYHCYSVTFIKAMEKAFALFGEDFGNQRFIAKKKSIGKKSVYNVKVV